MLAFTHGRFFQNAATALIILNAVLLGLETSTSIMKRFGDTLLLLNSLIQFLFIIEIAIRVAAYWPSPAKFFREGWNIFDFVIVTLSLLPVAGAFAGVARLARVLRVVRIVSVSPSLRLIVETMLVSIPSLGHVILLLSLLLYVYGIIGFYLFSTVDPLHWGSLALSFLTLFQVITLEGWVEIQRLLLPTYPFAWFYFVSFIIIAVFVVINLFIAVVTNNLQSAKLDQHDSNSIEKDVARLRESLSCFEAHLEKTKFN